MKNFILLFILISFFAELALDSSTAFVRIETRSASSFFVKKAASPNAASSNQDSQEDDKYIVLGGASHSALPVVTQAAPFYLSSASDQNFSEFLIPKLSPPKARIERPPIV